jgi:hypothetical protein
MRRPLGPDYSAITSISSASPKIDTAQLFDGAFVDAGSSPVDQFLSNANELNLIYIRANPLGRVLSSLVFLGYISAVESYVRALIRGLVNIDEIAQHMVEAKPVSFGAAVSHDRQLLPEALLEEYSFSSPDNIKNTLEKLTGVSLPSSFTKGNSEFRKLCQLRHCCTHRFGKLGTKNAIELGLASHKHILEKPVALSITDLNQIAESLRTYVKGLNNAAYAAVLQRSVDQTQQQKQLGRIPDEKPTYSSSWHWDYRRDKSRFGAYYTLFATRVDSIVTPSQVEMYNRFRSALKP